MSSLQLPNYLRANRKRLALSQDEVAFLLGAQSGAKVSRYERFARQPTLETALACEAIFQRPASELFAGLYQKVERQVAERARALTYKVEQRKAGRPLARKHQAFENMASAAPKLRQS